jgi:hypothetical protein
MSRPMNHYTAARLYVSPRQRRPLTQDEVETRRLAYAIKDPDCSREDRDTAADDMAALMDPLNDAILIPIPSSTGDTTANRLLAREIAARHTEHTGRLATVRDIICRAQPVESSCSRHRKGRAGLTAAEHGFTRRPNSWITATGPVYLIDNVTTTGATLAAAHAALHFGTGLVFADAAGTIHPERNTTK